jgi:hypothetical protein
MHDRSSFKPCLNLVVKLVPDQKAPRPPDIFAGWWLQFNILYNQMQTDIEVCYKIFAREVLQALAPTTEGFGFEIEIGAQTALARRWCIYEVGIAISAAPMRREKRSIGETGSRWSLTSSSSELG